MRTLDWPCPAADGSDREFALIAGPEDAQSVLIMPALFEEANRTRRLLAQTMRALAMHGIASVLPDLPGCNESQSRLENQDLASWRASMAAAAQHFSTSRVLCLRGGAILAPPDLPGWWLEPLGGAAALRHLVRTRMVAAREAGQPERSDALMPQGRSSGLELAGYRLNAAMVRDLEGSDMPTPGSGVAILALADLGGSALWLRSEPGEDADMAQALAATIARDMA